MSKSRMWAAGFMLSALFSMHVEAKLYKWVDDNGVTHYGEVIPPEYANKERDSLNKSGLLDKRPEKVNPEAIRAKEEAAQKKNIDNRATMEQQRRDSALLNTYSNENEIDMARDRSMVLIEARIESNKMLLLSSQSTLDGYRKEFDSRTKTGKKIPQALHNDIAQTEARVARYRAELVKSEADLAAVKARFQGEKELYRNLKGSAAKP